MFSNTEEAKKSGWFSRRHQDDVAHRHSGETLHEKKARKREEAEARQKARDERGDEEQLKKLYAEGHGDCSEAQWLRDKLAGRL